MWMPVHQNIQILLLSLWDVNYDHDYDTLAHEVQGPEYDLSIMPNLKRAILIGPHLRCPVAIPRSLSKLLLDTYSFRSYYIEL